METKRRSIVSIAVTLTIVVLLLISGHVSAVQVEVATDQTAYNDDGVVVFSLSVDIEQSERMPVQNFTLIIRNSTETIKECVFSIDGTASCPGMTVTKIETISYGYGYQYAYGYGYGTSGWGTANQSFGYGYGYGYNTGYTGAYGEMRYNVTWNLSSETLSEGEHSAYLEAFASQGSDFRIYKNEEAQVFAYDLTGPNVSVTHEGDSHDLTPILVATTNENATCTYNNNTFNFTGGTVHRQGLSLNEGTYTYTVNCTDTAGNTGAGTHTFTLTENRGGGGGSSFGIFKDPGTPAISVDHQWSEIKAGKTTIMHLEEEGIAIREITFTTPKDALSPSISVRQTGLPTVVPPKGEVFQYMKINAQNLPSGTQVKIKFQVPLAWLVNRSIEPKNIGLFKFINEWKQLPTTFISKDTKYAYYEAESMGFSYFAIAPKAESKPAPKEESVPTANVITPPPPEPEEKETRIWPIVIVLLVVIAGVILFVMYKHGHPMAKHIEKIVQSDPMQKAIIAAKRWIVIGHMKGKNNLALEMRLVQQGWPKELAKKMILETAGPDQTVDPLEKIHEIIAEAKEHGKSNKEIKRALLHAGWPQWKVDELLG